MDIIEKEFFHIAIKHGDLLLYSAEDGVKVVERCKKLNIPVKGFEVLKLYGAINQYKEHEGAIRPNMELEWPLNDETKALDMWEETKRQLLKRSYLCKLGYFFDLMYDPTESIISNTHTSIGLDYIYDEFSSVAINNGKRLLFYFKDAKKVVERCRELNLPIYGIYPCQVQQIFNEGVQIGTVLKEVFKNQVYYGLNWFEIDTWEAALQHLNSLSEETRLNCIFEIDYHNYGTIYVRKSHNWLDKIN